MLWNKGEKAEETHLAMGGTTKSLGSSMLYFRAPVLPGQLQQLHVDVSVDGVVKEGQDRASCQPLLPTRVVEVISNHALHQCLSNEYTSQHESQVMVVSLTVLWLAMTRSRVALLRSVGL